MDLTPGEYAMMTGLSAKAMRLYAERGILSPVSVDPSSGRRQYARSQLQHGMVIDSLRRARVPLSQLATASAFDFERWRDEVGMRRHLEDFYLALAERITAFDPSDLTPVAVEASPLDWIGVSIDLDVPDDLDGMVQTFAGLAAEAPQLYSAFVEALGDLGVPAADVCWTATPEGSAREPRMVMARPASQTSVDVAEVEQRVLDATGSRPTVLTGTLPRREEITFTTVTEKRPGNDEAIEEAASGHLHLLAFGDLCHERGLSPVGTGARVVVHGSSPFHQNGSTTPINVFDVLPTIR